MGSSTSRRIFSFTIGKHIGITFRGDVGAVEESPTKVKIGAVSGITDDQNDMAFLCSPSPTVMAMNGGIGLGCELDTGAETSLIPCDLFHRQLEPKDGQLRGLPKPVLVVGLEETGMPSLGYIDT